ncbi:MULTISPECIES: discoidin domain-containing protein [Niastella]|uniref:Discoidin domain-containing protein n=1 Tax=Niastella soli TaxID=2821487 RepID=A0ABS3Z542_9BACT|nr:discoidin domain-containing protein [Niastella soli]MBO9204775.1 discoidin domain-containing protein [Niastella soli]
MKKLIINSLSCCLILATGSCKKDKTFSEESGDVKIYMSQAVSNNADNNGYTTISVVQRATGQVDSLFLFEVNAYFGGSGYPHAPGDVQVSFQLDYSKWDSINADRQKAGLPLFEKIPDSVFSFPNTTAVIKSGNNISENIVFKISSKKIQKDHNYMIPLGIASVNNGYQINTQKGTAYFLVKAEDPSLDRKNWTINEFDSQEASGEGPNNGRAVFVLDGNTSTFWTSQWDGVEPPLPHHVSIDMHATITLNGVIITRRQNVTNGSPKAFTVDVSTDGTNWKTAGTYELASVNAKQFFVFVTPMSARYFRITVTTVWGVANSTFLSEIGAF